MPSKKTTVVKTTNISKTYFVGDIKIEAVKNVNLKINQGDFVSIVGKSGSGKSTLMHLVGLLDNPTDGKLYFKGKNTTDLDENAKSLIRNTEIGFIFQSFNLLKRSTVLENVLLPLQYSKVPRAKWMQKALEILDKIELSTRINNKSNELSGGQKQRVAIARALINDPSLILADEPTGNLDSKTGKEIENLFKKLNKEGKTVVIVTHDEDLAKITKRKIIVKDGEIHED